ncbi:MAG: TIGR01212 family radical SAM protein [Eubacteriales bacterium]|jgi:radical SAM protein (TIGR01212 family)
MNNPFPYSDTNKRYHTWDYHLKHKFGGKVFKVPLDGGFSCPNIDGTRGRGGCTYCRYTFARQTPDSLLRQFETHKAALHQKWPQALYIPYFQANTNTYAPVEELRAKYETVLDQPGVVGLAIATRPDALPSDVLDYLQQLGERTYLTVELGLQSAFDDTAQRIHRGHTWQEFLEGYEALRRRNIPVCVHIINGLPGENRSRMVETVRRLAELEPHSLKIHLLHILRGTAMEAEYLRGEVQPLTLMEYAETVCDQLEVLPPQCILQRVTGDGLKEELVAPLWSLRKFVVMNEIDKELVRRDSWQGKYQRAESPASLLR